MANEEHMEILKQGVEIWNQWRDRFRDLLPDLRDADLTGLELSGADLSRARLAKAHLLKAILRQTNLRSADLSSANLRRADLFSADLMEANLSSANLSGANLTSANLDRASLIGADLSGARLTNAKLGEAKLTEAYLHGANLEGADLHASSLIKANLTNAWLMGADLRGTNLGRADLTRSNFGKAKLTGANLRAADLRHTKFTDSDLRDADLMHARLVGTNFENGDLTNCRIWGISAWGIQLEGAIQTNLIITPEEEPAITVNDLELAQFIYLLLNNKKIRQVIDTITSKVVLILGRFTSERKAVLDALREELREHDYSPVIFDFDKPASRDLTETVTTLARMSRFIIADLTDPRSIPQELYAIVPHLRSVPVLPLLEGSARPHGMVDDLWAYPWFLEVYRYQDVNELLTSLKDRVIAPAEAKVKELQERS
jgi:uncharacterized protein YjbI with pentapeptide repeats